MRVEKLDEEEGRSVATPPPLRVLILIKGLGPGGAEHLLALAAEVRNRADFHYEVGFLLPWKDALVERVERSGVPVHCLRGGAAWRLGWAARLRKLLLEGRFDVVHVHSPYVASFARIVTRSIMRKHRPKVISTEHLPWSGHARPTRVLNRATFRLDSAHVAVSRAVRESIPPRLRAGVETLVHGIDLAKVRAEARDRDAVRAGLGLERDEVVVATVANFTLQKGYPYLLDAAAQLAGRHVPVRFLVIGQGPLEREIRAQHEALGLGDRVAILGFHPNPPKVLAACDIFVLPSLYEGLPLALMEALALGLPVVATDVDGTREAVTDGVEAVLVPPRRADLLAAAIEDLAGDPELRRRMGAAARERAAAFDIRRAVARIEGIYAAVGRDRNGDRRQRG